MVKLNKNEGENINMFDKLIEINTRAHDSLIECGNWDKELEELKHADITQQQIVEYRLAYPEMAYVFEKIKGAGAQFELLDPKMTLTVPPCEVKSSKLDKMIQQFLEWEPDYSAYDTKAINEIRKATKTTPLYELGILQGARVEQLRLVRALLDQRKEETTLYYSDSTYLTDTDTREPYEKFKEIQEMIDSQGEKLCNAPEFSKPVKKHYSFTRCMAKGGLETPVWTKYKNGKYALQTNLYLALLLAFYLGFPTYEEISLFLNCFGISLETPAELINNVPILKIKEAIKYGIHFDNIIYYLREPYRK